MALTAPARPELAAGPRSPETFPSRDLIGLTLPELRARMGRGLLIGDVGPMLTIWRDDEPPMSFLTLEDALADPWAAARQRLGATPDGDTTSCATAFGPIINIQTATASKALLVFRGELLVEIRHPQNTLRAPVEERSGAGGARGQPKEHVFLTEPGQLPLADGASFLRRWHSQTVGPSEQITVRCDLRRTTPAQPVRASVSEAVMLAPLSAFASGGVAGLQLGQPVPGGAATFDKQNARASYYPGKDGYGVMAFDLGVGAATFAGVRNDRVVWIAQEGGSVGFPSAMMCLDENFVSGSVRKGCSGKGEFNPAR